MTPPNDFAVVIRGGRVVDPALEPEREALTLETYAERRLEVNVTINCKPRTLELYTFLCRRHLFPALGAVRLRDLTRDGVQSLVAKKDPGRDLSTRLPDAAEESCKSRRSGAGGGS